MDHELTLPAKADTDENAPAEQTDHLLDLISGKNRKETKKAAAASSASKAKAPENAKGKAK
jgi:hypothetical protein